MAAALLAGALACALTLFFFARLRFARLRQEEVAIASQHTWAQRFHANGDRLAEDPEATTDMLRDIEQLNDLLGERKSGERLARLCAGAQTSDVSSDDFLRAAGAEGQPSPTMACYLAALSAGLLSLSYLEPEFDTGLRVFWAEAYGMATGLLGETALLWAIAPLTDAVRGLCSLRPG